MSTQSSHLESKWACFSGDGFRHVFHWQYIYILDFRYPNAQMGGRSQWMMENSSPACTLDRKTW